jgi:hypothetical protein
VAATTRNAVPASATGASGNPVVVGASVPAEAAEGDARCVPGAVVVADAARSPGETSVPTPSVPAGTAKPQSSNSFAWSAARSGVFSVSITLTTSRRPARSAAVTNVCRAASVKPVFPPRLPG